MRLWIFCGVILVAALSWAVSVDPLFQSCTTPRASCPLGTPIVSNECACECSVDQIAGAGCDQSPEGSFGFWRTMKRGDSTLALRLDTFLPSAGREDHYYTVEFWTVAYFNETAAASDPNFGFTLFEMRWPNYTALQELPSGSARFPRCEIGTTHCYPYQLLVLYRGGEWMLVYHMQSGSFKGSTDQDEWAPIIVSNSDFAANLTSGVPVHAALVLEYTKPSSEADDDFQTILLYINGLLVGQAQVRTRSDWDSLQLHFGTWRHKSNHIVLQQNPSPGSHEYIGPDIILDTTQVDGLYMDEIRLWWDSLAQDVIQGRMFEPLVGDENDLLLYLNFDEAYADLTASNDADDDSLGDALPTIAGQEDSDALDLGDAFGYYQDAIGPNIYPVYSSPVAVAKPEDDGPALLISVLQIKANRGPQPPWLVGHSASIIGDTLFIFGGCTTLELTNVDLTNLDTDPLCSSDMYKFNVTTREWTRGAGLTLVPLAPYIGTALHGCMYFGPRTVLPQQAPRSDGLLLLSATVIGDYIYYVGGNPFAGLLCWYHTVTDTWDCDGDIAKLDPIKSLGLHTVTKIGNKLFILFGGEVSLLATSIISRDRALVFDLDTRQLVEFVPESNLEPWPTPRVLHCAVPYQTDKILMFGGIENTVGQGALNDLWELDTTTLKWKQLRATGTSVPDDSNMWWSCAQAGPNMLLFGGASGFDLYSVLTGTFSVDSGGSTTSVLEDIKRKQFRLLDTSDLTFSYALPDVAKGAFKPTRFGQATAITTDASQLLVLGGLSVDRKQERNADPSIWADESMLVINIGCPAGSETSSSSTCSKCPAGQYQPISTLSTSVTQGVLPRCLPCPPGTYQDQAGASSCTACPMNTFNSGEGTMQCVACPNDRPFTSSTGATNDTACMSQQDLLGINIPAIAGGVTGGILALAAVGGTVAFIAYRRYRSRQKQIEEQVYGPISTELDVDSSKFGFAFLRAQDISFREVLGSGSFGTVHKGVWEDKIVAIKVSQPGVREAVMEFLAEAEIMMKLKPHPNVIQLVGVALSGGSTLVVLEYANSGSLHSLLTKNERQLNENELRDLFRQVTLGLQHIHAANLIHRDLATRNILLDRDDSGKITARVSDFGMSRAVAMDLKEGHTKTTFGPVPWMSPEAISRLEYSTASDVWSLGVLLWEMVTGGRDPGAVMPLPDLALAIRDTNYHPPFPPFLPEWAERILQGCWVPDPRKRLTLEQIIDVCDESWTAPEQPGKSNRNTVAMPRSLFAASPSSSAAAAADSHSVKKKSKNKNSTNTTNATTTKKHAHATNKTNKANKSYDHLVPKADNPFLLPQPPAEMLATIESLRAKLKALESGSVPVGSSSSASQPGANNAAVSKPPPRRGASKKRTWTTAAPNPSNVRNTVDV